MENILITGALGQLGSELVPELQKKYGRKVVYATDIQLPVSFAGNFDLLDVTNTEAVRSFVKKNSITQIYHLAAILSAKAETSPTSALHINIEGLMNILEISKEVGIKKIFWPSSIAVFGPDAPKDRTPQDAPLNPTSIYGITKVTGEKLCAYYRSKYDLDIRSLRYPGLIGYRSMPGGGTTDYAVEIFHKALNEGSYTCPLAQETKLPMMYMPDAVRATLEIMEAEKSNIKIPTSYNLSGFSFAPKQLAEVIQSFIPDFDMKYQPDFRNEIALTWPDGIDDSRAQKDWKWKAAYNLIDMTEEMICRLKKNLKTADIS